MQWQYLPEKSNKSTKVKRRWAKLKARFNKLMTQVGKQLHTAELSKYK